jgi:ABC-type nitrate/sulfonate/bicarbonate transport system substrate-binding protein
MKTHFVSLASTLTLLSFVQTVTAQIITLRYGQIPSTVKTVSALQFAIAQRKGFFLREGINLDMLLIEGGAANMMVALNEGKVDITRTATPYLIQSVLKGSEGVAIAGETATPIYSLIVKPESKPSPISEAKLSASLLLLIRFPSRPESSCTRAESKKAILK